MVLISCTSKVLIYDVNNNQLITSISRGVDNKGTSDSIFCDKNNSVYIIINMNNNLSSLIYPQCKVYKNYCNYYSEAEFFRYPRVFKFENNITYLLTIFHKMLYIFDFHTGNIIKELYMHCYPYEFLFWNSETLLFLVLVIWHQVKKLIFLLENLIILFIPQIP